MTIMGIDVYVRSNAFIHTPTAENLTMDQLDIGPLPGRADQGFNGGTGIVLGESIGGVFYASDVFSDLAENVVVGEATGVTENANGVERMTINGMELIRLKDPRMPAGPAINAFGFAIQPTAINPGSLVAAEGYFAKGRLYYHTLEADSAPILRPDRAEVSMMRADCRVRGGGRDEIEVRGGTHNAAGQPATSATVQIARVNPAIPLADVKVNNNNHWIFVGFSDAPVVDTTVTPPQATYRFDGDNITLGAEGCPALLRAQYLPPGAGARPVYDTIAPESR
jgi:hypothetical protein